MKKITLILLALITLTNTSFSQDKPADKKDKKVAIGLQLSPSLNWMKPDANSKTISNDGVKINLSYGLIFDYKFSQNISLLTGFNVAYNTGKLKISYDSLEQIIAPSNTKTTFHNLNGSKTYKLQYLEIPIMLKMSTNEIGYLTYFANIGVGLGANLKAKGNYTYTTTGGSKIDVLTKSDEVIKDDINFMRATFIVGAGAKYSLGGNTSMIASVNFNNGLTNVLKDEKGGKAIANCISLNVGIVF